MTAPTLPQEIAWSRNARAHLALLQQSVPASVRDSSVSPTERGAALEEATPFAQASAAGGPQQLRLVPVDFVTVDTMVVDSAGQPVLDLRESDFQVFENGVQQTIESLVLLKSNIEQRPYYLLNYRVTTAPAAESFRRIEVRVDRPGVRVAARAGYRLRAPYPDRTALRDELERLDALAQDGFSRGAHTEGEAGLVVPVPRERRQPSYPSEAIVRRIQGRVVVEAVVDVDGRVSRSRVASSLDNGRFGLDNEALNAVSQWTFTPGELKGQKVPVLMRFVVTFQMHGP
jgi:TonB family protein